MESLIGSAEESYQLDLCSFRLLCSNGHRLGNQSRNPSSSSFRNKRQNTTTDPKKTVTGKTKNKVLIEFFLLRTKLFLCLFWEQGKTWQLKRTFIYKSSSKRRRRDGLRTFKVSQKKKKEKFLRSKHLVILKLISNEHKS